MLCFLGWSLFSEVVNCFVFLYSNGKKSVDNIVVSLLYLLWTIFSCPFFVCWESHFLQVCHTVYFNRVFFTEAFTFWGCCSDECQSTWCNGCVYVMGRSLVLAHCTTIIEPPSRSLASRTCQRHPRHCVCGSHVCSLCASWPEHPNSCLITPTEMGQDVKRVSHHKTQCKVFPIPTWNKAASGLSLMKFTRKRNKPARGSQRFLPWYYLEEFSAGKHRRACGRTEDEAQPQLSPPACRFLCSHWPLCSSPLPPGLLIEHPRKSALFTERVYIVSFSIFSLFKKILQIFFFLSDPFCCTAEALELSQEWQKNGLFQPPLHNRRRRIEMQLRENKSNKWWWTLFGWRSRPAHVTWQSCDESNAFCVRYVSLCECARENKSKILFSCNSHQRNASFKWTEDSELS